MPLLELSSRANRMKVAALLSLTTLAALVFAPFAPASAAERPVSLDHGHVDVFSLMMIDGVPALRLSEDVTGSHVVHDPEDVNLVVKQDALIDLPDSESLPPDTRGKQMFYLPLGQDENLLWPGWDSQSLAGSGFDQVDITIQAVDGPGRIFLWSTGPFGELTSLLTDGGYALPTTIHQDYFAHVHANWVFSAPGIYNLTVQATAINSTTGERVPTNTGTYQFSVGDIAPLPSSVTIDGLQNPYQHNAPIQLTATPDVAVTDASYVWESRTGDGAWQVDDGQTSATYSGAAAVDAQQLRVSLTAAGTTITSDPVTIELVEPEPQLPTSLAISGAAQSYEDGAAVALTATPDVPVPDATYRWETKNPGGDWTIVASQTSAAYSGTATVDGQLIRATITVASTSITSLPVTIALSDTNEPETCFSVDIDHGHVDVFDVSVVNGVPALQLKEDVTGSRVVRDPKDVNLVVKQDALTPLPDSESLPPDTRGKQMFYLPLGQDQNLLWPGWDSQSLTGTGFDQVDLTIGAVNGPGTVYLWSSGVFGELTSLLADGGYALPNTIRQGFLAHVHANWAFSAPGAYTFTVTATAINSNTGERRATNTGTYLFSVGEFTPEPDYKECPGGPSTSPTPSATPSTSSPTPTSTTPTPTTTVTTQPTTPVPRMSASGSATPSCVPLTVSPRNTATKKTTTTPTTQMVVGSEGHFDFGPVVQNGTLSVLVKDDRSAPPVWRDPNNVVFELGPKALRRATTIPSALSFIAPPGQDVYMIQQIQESGVPWIGWNTQHESIVNGLNNASATMTLDKVDGPGNLAIFLSGNFGTLVGQRVVDNVGGPKSYVIPANTHQHGNWIFTKPGVYTVTFTISAGGRSDTVTLRFAVGQKAPVTTTESSVSVEGRTESGQPCRLATTGVRQGLGGFIMAGGVAVLAGALVVGATRRRRIVAVR